MRIYEILFWDNDSTEENRSNPHIDLPSGPFDNDSTNLATAFTKDGRVKHLLNPDGSEGQPPGPAPPDAETELSPTGTLEPTTGSLQAEPVETEPPMGLHRLVPFRQYEGVSGD
jgi:hypothetical protein